MGKRKRRRSRRESTKPPSAPPMFIRAVERHSQAAQEMASGTPPKVAIEMRRQALRALIAPADPVLVLGHLLNSEVPIDPENYRETAHEGLAYVAELVAAEVLLRPSSPPRSAETTPPLDGNFLDEVRRLTQEAMSFEVFQRYRNAGALGDPAGKARGSAALQHLMMRSPGWPWQEHDVLRSLFGPEHIDVAIRDSLGFGVADAIACCEVMTTLLPSRSYAHMQQARNEADEVNDGHPARRWAHSQLSGWDRIPEAKQDLLAIGLWALNTIGDAYVMQPSDLAAAADISEEAAVAYLGAMSQPMGQDEVDWFAMAESLRERPWIDLGDRGYVLTIPGNDLWALRGMFEQQLKSSESYRRHRGSWLEQRAAKHLEDALHPDEIWRGVRFSYEDAEGAAVEGEIDALLRVGDVALVVEAKSATMRLGARRGGEALLKHLDQNLRKAIEQGNRALEGLADEASLTVRGKPISLSERIREVHLILVTLDDLSAVAPVLWELRGTRYVPEATAIPWVVTLHELDLVCQTVEWPTQFIHFLRRRARLNAHQRHVASDELDWWMHYLTAGLYFDDEEDEGPVRFMSLTDPLDAWVLHDQGIRENPEPKPRMNLDDDARRFLDLLSNERPPGWVAGSCMFLEINGASRKRVWQEISRLRKRASARDRVQRFTLGFSESHPPQMICGVVVPDQASKDLSTYLRHLADERLKELGTQRVLGIGVCSSSSRPYDALLIFNETWRPNE